jgi:hypothetical protein
MSTIGSADARPAPAFVVLNRHAGSRSVIGFAADQAGVDRIVSWARTQNIVPQVMPYERYAAEMPQCEEAGPSCTGAQTIHRFLARAGHLGRSRTLRSIAR